MMFYFLCVLLGCFSGFCSSLLSIGGAMIVVPGLVAAYTLVQVPLEVRLHLAIGTSFFIMTINSAYVALSNYRKGTTAMMHFVSCVLPWILLGTACGVWLQHGVPTFILGRLFACFLFLVCLKFLLTKPAPKETSKETLSSLASKNFLSLNWEYGLVFCIGFVAGVLGIGGAVLLLPWLTEFKKLAIRQAIGTCTLLVFPISIVALLSVITVNYLKPVLGETRGILGIDFSAALCILPASLFFARLGLKLVPKIKESVLRYLFAAVVFSSGGSLLWNSF